MNKNVLRAAVTGLILSISSAVNAGIIQSGASSLDVNTNNGAIDSLSFKGVDWFNSGTFVSNYGFYYDGVFNSNATSGGTSVNANQLLINSFSESLTSVSVFGTYANDFGFTRTYSIVNGHENIFSIKTTLTNNSDSFASILGFETFDPDPIGFNTYNDLRTLSNGTEVALSKDNDTNDTFLLSSQDAIATDAGGIFAISQKLHLDLLMNTPIDGNGELRDLGLHVGFRYDLDSDESMTTTTYLAFSGDGFDGATTTLTAIPEPSTLALFSLAVIGLATARRRRS